MAMTLNANEQERVNNVYNEREKALAENNSMYEGLINDAGAVRDQQNAYLAQQQQIQNENLDKQLAYQEGIVNQQKEEAKQNQRVEENKAKNAYQNYINPYGLQNERLYSAGLGNSGVSETSKLGAYTTYQNRVSAAAGAYQKAITNYDNDINQARLNNDVQKAQNALNKLKLELQNTQDYYSNVASLSQQKLKSNQSLQSQYLDQYNTVYNQILNERKFDESVRQWNKEYSLSQEKLALEREKARGNSLSLDGGGLNLNGSLDNVPAGYGVTTVMNGAVPTQVAVPNITTVMIGGVPIQVTQSQANELKSNPNGKLAKSLKEQLSKKKVTYNDTGAILDNKKVLKGSDGNYYDDNYKVVPVIQETSKYLMLDNGQILVK